MVNTDYEIELDTLQSKESELLEIKTKSEDIYNEFNSCYLSQLSSTEISSLPSSIKPLVERLKKGVTNSNTWYTNYCKELDSLENNLASFSAPTLETPKIFNSKFEDLFSKATMPVLKTGGDIHALAAPKSPDTGEATTFTVNVPDDLKQAGYTVTGYDYWIDSGNTMVWNSSTNQRKVADIWKQQGSRFKNGIAVINVNGVDHYLIATAKVFGKVGDSVSVHLKNGQTVPCIIADAKSTHDSTYTQYGHRLGSGINILEFEVQRSKYKQSGNPKTSTWGLEWDSSSGVKTVDNHGSIV